MLEKIIHLDESLLEIIRTFFGSSDISRLLVVAFADIQVLLVMLLLVGLWLYGVHKRQRSYREQSLHMFFGICMAFIVYVLLNQFLPIRPRPESVSSIPPLISHLPDNSFPSGHAIFAAAATYMGFIVFGSSWLSWILLVSGIVMCILRIAAGVHYPGDIFVGYILGLSVVMILYGPISRTDVYKKLINLCVYIASKIRL